MSLSNVVEPVISLIQLILSYEKLWKKLKFLHSYAASLGTDPVRDWVRLNLLDRLQKQTRLGSSDHRTSTTSDKKWNLTEFVRAGASVERCRRDWLDVRELRLIGDDFAQLFMACGWRLSSRAFSVKMLSSNQITLTNHLIRQNAELLVNANSQWQQLKACRTTCCESRTSIRVVKKRGFQWLWTPCTRSLDALADWLLLICWEFHQSPNHHWGFQRRVPKKRKYPVSSPIVGKNTSLTTGVRGQTVWKLRRGNWDTNVHTQGV